MKSLDLKMIDFSKYSQTTQLLALRHAENIQPRIIEVLLRIYRTTENILLAGNENKIEFEGMPEDINQMVQNAIDYLDTAIEIEKDYKSREISIVNRFDTKFPVSMFELNDPPSHLFYKGKMPDNNSRSVSIVGAVNASSDGIELSATVSKKFASEKVSIVSSLSGGIDFSAHLAAKANGGESFAVIDCGFDNIISNVDIPIAIDIVQTGGIISEYLTTAEATEDSLPEANRLITALGQAVVIVELYDDSYRTKDLIQFCNDIGKLLFFVIDTDIGALADEKSLHFAVDHGAILIKGLEHIDDIILSLV